MISKVKDGAASVLIIGAAFLCASCATQPKTYQPPSPTKLNASTLREAKAVEAAHVSARKAQVSVSAAARRAKEVQTETAKIKNLPTSLIEKVNDLESQLATAAVAQAELETHLNEADAAKAAVEQDKAEYYTSAQKLARDATDERNHVISVEKQLSWYRWHSLLLKIGSILVVVVIVVLIILKVTGKLAFHLLI